MSSPRRLYDSELAEGLMLPDAAQAAVVDQLQRLHEQLSALNEEPRRGGGLLRRLLGRDDSTVVQAPRGLYIWGGVGRGKTHLCDMFFKTVQTERKRRMHYHRFMLQVHQELKALGNTVDPIDKITAGWAERVRLLVLDEMHINDITDALLMRHLLKGLFERGVVLVTTSNRPPQDLYYDGLQREQFLPAIDLLLEYTDVVNLDSERDYRLRALEQTPVYITPIEDDTHERLERIFEDLSGHDDAQLHFGAVVINEREVPMVKRCTGVVWFGFGPLCDSPRSNSDYIEITNYFHTVIISDVPVMDASKEDAARRFVNMIDEFYDHGTKLIVSAEAPPEQIYQGRKLEFEFDRAVSRLLEMQSKEYLASERNID
ncbi:cell division protein ZapE [Granulosicoccaceae sp. 1_MG-2023]|nr:cell division protein ZapE [Granulosicoccaceae sp. 1_MG-2023]